MATARRSWRQRCLGIAKQMHSVSIATGVLPGVTRQRNKNLPGQFMIADPRTAAEIVVFYWPVILQPNKTSISSRALLPTCYVRQPVFYVRFGDIFRSNR